MAVLAVELVRSCLTETSWVEGSLPYQVGIQVEETSETLVVVFEEVFAC